MVLVSSKTVSTLKGKNLLPLGANSILLEYLFQKGLESEQEVTKIVAYSFSVNQT